MKVKRGFWNYFRRILLVSLLAITLSGLVLQVSRVSSKSTGAPIGNDSYLYLPIVVLLPCGFVDEKEPNDTFSDSEANDPVPQNETFLGCFADQNDINDVYYFELNTPSTIEVSLQNIMLGHDYDLVLYDANRNPIEFSNNPGNQDEHILTSQIKAKQRYFIQVYNFGKTASTIPYHLLVQYDFPPPLECDILPALSDVFPQLKDEPDAYLIYGSNPEDDPNFQCLAVFDIVYNEELAIHIEYNNEGENWGFWGVNLAPTGYDASGFTEICLRATAEEPIQTFFLKLKDLTGKEIQKPIVVQHAIPWKQYCIQLSEYEQQGEGVDITRLENINVGFDKNSGDAIVWLDDFLFK